MRRELSLLLLLASLSSCYLSVPFQGLPRGRVAPPLEIERWWNTDAPFELEPDRTRPLLIEFWSSACPPCVKSIPKLQRAIAGYADRLDVVTVHVELERTLPADPTTLEAFLHERGIDYPVGIDDEGAQWERYAFAHLPHAVIVDPDLRVLWSGNLVLHDLERVLRKRFGPPTDSGPTAGHTALARPTARYEHRAPGHGGEP